MIFRPATKADLKIVMTWIPDADSCLGWAGSKVRFPLELEQLCQDIEFEMLVITGGRERTEAEYRHLFKLSGFKLSRIIPTKGEVCIIEGIKEGK
jgi:hypothetical protein